MERHIAVLDLNHNVIGVIIADDKVNERFRELISAHYDAEKLKHANDLLFSIKSLDDAIKQVDSFLSKTENGDFKIREFELLSTDTTRFFIQNFGQISGQKDAAINDLLKPHIERAITLWMADMTMRKKRLQKEFDLL